MAADEREAEMLELMRECSMTLRRCENKLNEIWAEWTRTHGLRGIPGKDKATIERQQVAEHTRNTIKRSLPSKPG